MNGIAVDRLRRQLGDAGAQANDGPLVGFETGHNMADARRTALRNTSWLQSKLGWPWRANAATRQTLGLSRLPGSGREIEACGSEWRKGSTLVQGLDVTRENVRRLVESHTSVAHFATHVLQDPQNSMNALLALGVSGAGREELLGAAEIGGWSTDAGVVVLSLAPVSALPGPGLMGLTQPG